MGDEAAGVVEDLGLYKNHDERFDWIVIMRLANGNVMITKDTAMMDTGDAVIARVRPDDYMHMDGGELYRWAEGLLARGP